MQELSPIWQKRFAIIEKAGGPGLPLLKTLSFRERSVAFNALAFLFCPFYYFAKGMWKKALTYFVIVTILIFVIEYAIELLGIGHALEGVTKYLGPVIYATRANIDFYKKIKLNQDTWI